MDGLVRFLKDQPFDAVSAIIKISGIYSVPPKELRSVYN